uniref:Putative N-acetyltransferase p20 n=1 Tax=Anthurium amnicola TaxID=1678845 RepID=A0A1D1XUD4_9ARAE
MEPPPPEVTLRPFDLSDVDDLMAWASDPRVTRFSRRGPVATREAALRHLQHGLLRRPWCRAICLGGRPVGSVSVAPGAHRCRASLGYRVAHAHWGKGVATAAVRRAAAEVFEEMPHLERLEAVADVDNPASQRVLEKAGFQREALLRKYFLLHGVARDVVMYSLVVPDDLVGR